MSHKDLELVESVFIDNWEGETALSDIDDETLATVLADAAHSVCFNVADAFEERERFRLKANAILEALFDN